VLRKTLQTQDPDVVALQVGGQAPLDDLRHALGAATYLSEADVAFARRYHLATLGSDGLVNPPKVPIDENPRMSHSSPTRW
jgi:hypothetical protein